jgi:predicted alpha/beta-fold hydrolase
LNALDDPIIDPSLYPFKELETSEHVIAGFTTKGGHCGHFTGGWLPTQWFANPLLQFLDHLEAKARVQD